MTSGNDRKGPPPPRRPAPPGAPQRPAGPTTGGSAARPAPRPGAPAPRPAAPAPRPAPRAPVYEADADEKTSAINLADMGLDENEATVSVEGAALRARAAASFAGSASRDAASFDEEKTTAFNVADLPPEDEPKRPAQKTLLGHPAPKATGGAAVRGGAAPVRRAETQAIAPSMTRGGARAPAPHVDDEKTSALSLDDIEKIDAAPARPSKFSPPPQEEKTAAMSLDDIDKIDMRPTPQRGGKAPAHIAQDEKTMAVSLDDIDRIDAAPRRGARAASSPELEALQEEKTTAMSLADIDKIEARPAAFSKRAPAPAAKAPQRGRALGGQTPDGFLGAVAYVFQADAREERGEAVDEAKKAAGLRNLIVVGGAVAALMLAIGFIF